MKKFLESPYLSLLVRVVLGGIFIIWSVGKIADPVKFAEEIMNYRMVPLFFVNIMAMTFPWVELVAGVLLVAGVRLKANSAIIGGMLVMFIIAILIAMIQGLDIGCGCSTESATKVGLPKILEDLAMLLGAVYIFYFPNKRLTLENLALKEIEYKVEAE